ncbi:type II toxin-antitoxin system RelE/ParE family toxin [Sphingomonas sp. PWP1-2]|uniref:type II toxin-antitoxin system RelE/ParE family toxin n=1 Tax=Sphingomonas sp. PWP1-2 TaxID=2804558 RepID=UPI003CF058C8
MAVRWSAAARSALTRIFEFNAAYSAEYAERIDARLFGAAELIERNPRIGRRIAGTNVRKRSLSDIQYVVRYRIDAAGDITIVNVRHTRENRQERP